MPAADPAKSGKNYNGWGNHDGKLAFLLASELSFFPHNFRMKQHEHLPRIARC